MKYLLFLFMLFSSAIGASAQIVMNLQLPPAGIVLKEQLWNLSLVNPDNSTALVQLQMQLTDVSTNQPVLTAVSRTFEVPKGVKQIKSADVLPITYNVLNSAYPVDASPNGFLPVGVFNVCFTLLRVSVHGEDHMSDECVTVEVEPVSPPSLVLPADLDKVETSRPVFTWIPPAPVNLFTRLTYDLVLVEVLPLQSPADAITQNIPFLVSPDISFTSLQYPTTLTALDTAKTYAWRVKAKNNGLPIANSETWTFKVGPEQKDQSLKIRKGYYIKLSRQEDGSLANCDGLLEYQYNNELNDTLVNIHLYDITKARRLEIKLPSNNTSVAYGLNFLQLPLNSGRTLTNRHIYLFELINAKEERWYLKFEYNKSK